MSFDGNGNYTVPSGTDGITGQVIDSTKYNALLRDVEVALTKALLRDGQSAALANIPMGGYKLTGAAAGVTRAEIPLLSQVQDGAYNTLTGVAGTNTITATQANPTLAAYTSGLTLRLFPAVTNTGAVTLNVNGIGAVPVITGATPLGANRLLAGEVAYVTYDGANWQLARAGAESGINSSILELLGLTTVPTVVTSAIAASATPAGAIMWSAFNSALTGTLKCNGAAVSRATYAALFAAIYKSATVTMTLASPSVITWTAHGRSANDVIRFATTGALYTGFVASTDYYVVGASITTDTFQLSATAGGAAITTTGTQSGVHTAIHAPFGVGDGSTTFGIPDMRGEFPRGWDDARAVDSNRSFGSAQSADIGPHTHDIIVYNDNGSAGSRVRNTNNTATPGNQTSNANTGTETRPRNIALQACIKY